jgi:hypothetical protein
MWPRTPWSGTGGRPMQAPGGPDEDRGPRRLGANRATDEFRQSTESEGRKDQAPP